MRRPIVIVGTDAHAVRLLHTFQRRPDLGYEVLGFVGSDDIGERGGVKVLGTIDEIERVLDDYGANGVVVSPSSVQELRTSTPWLGGSPTAATTSRSRPTCATST